MGIGASLFLITSGAIARWGVETDPNSVNLDTIGGILMVVGFFGLLLSLLLFEDWAPWGRRRDRVVDDTRSRESEVVIDEPVGRYTVDEEPLVRRSVTTSRRVYR